jgi:hypothetical protein
MRDQAVIDDAQSKIAAAREELAKANRKFHRLFNAQEKRIKAEMAKETMTLALALTANFGDHAVSNEAGYDWLNKRCWNGEWAGLGIMQSGTWHHLNQHCLKLALKRIAADEQLDRLHAVLVEEILPVLKPGALYDPSGLMGRPDPKLKQFEDCRVLDIMASDLSESHNFMMMIRPDDSAEIWDLRAWRLDTPIYKGDLRGALTVVRNNCYWSVD